MQAPLLRVLTHTMVIPTAQQNLKVGYTITMSKRPILEEQIVQYFGLQMQNTMGLQAQ